MALHYGLSRFGFTIAKGPGYFWIAFHAGFVVLLVRHSFVCTRNLRADDWLLRSQPNCWIPSGGANLRRDGISGRRALPLSGLVRRCDWEASIRLVVRAEVDVAVAGHERVQPVSFDCTCGYNCCAVGVPWIQARVRADATRHFYRIRVSNRIPADADASVRQRIRRGSSHSCNNADPAGVFDGELAVTLRSIGGRTRGCKRHSHQCSDRRVGLVRLTVPTTPRLSSRFGCFALVQQF